MESRKPELTIEIPPLVLTEQSSEEEETNCTTASRVLIPCTMGLLILGLSSGALFFLIELSKIKWVMFQE